MRLFEKVLGKLQVYCSELEINQVLSQRRQGQFCRFEFPASRDEAIRIGKVQHHRKAVGAATANSVWGAGCRGAECSKSILHDHCYSENVTHEQGISCGKHAAYAFYRTDRRGNCRCFLCGGYHQCLHKHCTNCRKGCSDCICAQSCSLPPSFSNLQVGCCENGGARQQRDEPTKQGLIILHPTKHNHVADPIKERATVAILKGEVPGAAATHHPHRTKNNQPRDEAAAGNPRSSSQVFLHPTIVMATRDGGVQYP